MGQFSLGGSWPEVGDAGHSSPTNYKNSQVLAIHKSYGYGSSQWLGYVCPHDDQRSRQERSKARGSLTMMVQIGNVRRPLMTFSRALSSLPGPKNESSHSIMAFRRHHHLTPARTNSMRASVITLTTEHHVNPAYYRPFTTAYQGIPSDGKHNHQLLAHLIPYRSTLKDGRHVEVDFFRHSPTDIEEDEWFVGMALMNLVIREGLSWPFEDEFTSVDDWRAYFLSHTAFVVRATDNGMDAASRNSSSRGEVLGCFYIKPNFPGRCSHVCNGGFITAPRFRGLGIGRLMGKVFLSAARDSGYRSR